jgi:hypothetical protein
MPPVTPWDPSLLFLLVTTLGADDIVPGLYPILA